MGILNQIENIFKKKNPKISLKKKMRYNQKIDTFVDILDQLKKLSESSTLKVGCIIIKKDFSKLVYGYNGSYKGAPINPITGTEEDSLAPGMSGFLHAEQNAIAKFKEHDPENWIIIVSTSPCNLCMKLLINCGFKHIYWVDSYRETSHLDVLKDLDITCGDIDKLKDHYPDIIS